MSVLLYSFYFCHCYLLVAVAMPSPLSSRSLCIEIHWYPHSQPSKYFSTARYLFEFSQHKWCSSRNPHRENKTCTENGPNEKWWLWWLAKTVPNIYSHRYCYLNVKDILHLLCLCLQSNESNESSEKYVMIHR